MLQQFLDSLALRVYLVYHRDSLVLILKAHQRLVVVHLYRQTRHRVNQNDEHLPVRRVYRHRVQSLPFCLRIGYLHSLASVGGQPESVVHEFRHLLGILAVYHRTEVERPLDYLQVFLHCREGFVRRLDFYPQLVALRRQSFQDVATLCGEGQQHGVEQRGAFLQAECLEGCRVHALYLLQLLTVERSCVLVACWRQRCLHPIGALALYHRIQEPWEVLLHQQRFRADGLLRLVLAIELQHGTYL